MRSLIADRLPAVALTVLGTIVALPLAAALAVALLDALAADLATWRRLRDYRHRTRRRTAAQRDLAQ